MTRNFARFLAAASAIAASVALSAPPATPGHEDRADSIGRLMRDWQARILASNLPVDDAKNWARRNMARFSRLSAERLALAQHATTFGELELALMDSPIPTGSELGVLLAGNPGDITMVAKSDPATSPSLYSNLVFNALSPCRIYDSRVSQGGPGTWAAGSTNDIRIGPVLPLIGAYSLQGGSHTSCGLDPLKLPGKIAVIMAAVSTVSQAGAGYLTFFAAGAANPSATSVSEWYQPGYVQTSYVLIPTDRASDAHASGFTSAGTDVIIDVVGYFDTAVVNGNIVLQPSIGPDSGNIMKGSYTFLHDFGAQDTFIGESAGNFTMTGSDNTGTGWLALSANAAGSYNTATGSAALADNSGGGYNTGVGANALFSNTSGNSNTAAGMNALSANTTGGGNTAIGALSLAANHVGGGNTATGQSALFNNTGSNNIALGNGAGINLTTGDLNIDIGHPGIAAEANTIRIGDSSQSRTFVSGIRGVTTGNADAVAVMIDGNGQLGTVSSSRRYKNGIADMDAASDALMKLRPVTFYYKSDASSTLQYGLVAEEVAEIYPGLVAHSNDGQVETVMYQFLPPMLLNEYQKLRRTVERQEAEITRLKAAVTEIAALKEQTAHMAELLDRQRLSERNGAGLK